MMFFKNEIWVGLWVKVNLAGVLGEITVKTWPFICESEHESSAS